MRYAPAYTAEQLPGDFAASAVCAVVTAATLGPLVWWFARQYLRHSYPHHPEMLGAAVVTGILDGALLAALAFGFCFAIRIWRFERLQRQHSDSALRLELDALSRQSGNKHGRDGEPPLPHR